MVSSPLPSFRLARVVWVPLVVCAMGLLEQSAEASCGDYVHISGQMPTGAADVAGLPDHSTPDVPCQGPMCRNQTPRPFTPPAPPAPVTTPTDMLAGQFLAAPRLESAWHWLASEPLVKSGPGSSIFHPPRRGA